MFVVTRVTLFFASYRTLYQNVGSENGLLRRHLDCKCGSIGVCLVLLKHAFHNHVCTEQNNLKKGAGICLPFGPPVE